jgi:hypothetical protein
LAITILSRPGALPLDQPWFSTKETIALNHNLVIARNGKSQLVASRYVIAAQNIDWTTPNKILNILGVHVSMAVHGAYDVFRDDKHIRRPECRAGSISITDFRIRSFADLNGQPVDYLTIYVPIATLCDVLEKAGATVI